MGERNPDEHEHAREHREEGVNSIPAEPIAIERYREERRRARGADRAHNGSRQLRDAVSRPNRTLVGRGPRDEDKDAPWRFRSALRITWSLRAVERPGTHHMPCP